MKKFDNLAENGTEKAFRRGYTVPEGGVNVAWAKAPSMSPKNNTIIVDTSRISGENANISTKSQKLAYSNGLGILEDEDGNQVWDEEYPIISDMFSPQQTATYGDEFVDDDVLPYVHVSRYFHVDFVGISIGGLIEHNSGEIRVMDKNGSDYVYPDGRKKYKTFITPILDAGYSAGSREAPYRVYVFLDMNPLADELYLTYNKVELTKTGALRNQSIDHKETINPRPYYEYVPEESDVLDHTMGLQKIYSSKPVNLKEKALNLPQNNYQGWRLHVPRKAIPDPRIFQLFRWRLACEFVKPTSSTNTPATGDFGTTAFVKAGVIVPSKGTHQSTRANYLFYQLNQSDYNFTNIKFINPIKNPDISYDAEAQKQASYWHVDIETVTLEEISKFDILIWAPSSTDVTLTQYLPKIEHFTENAGGTLIFETSGFTNVTAGLSGFTFSPRLPNPVAPASTDNVTASTQRLYDATADDPNDDFSSYGMWKTWPPNVSDILTNYQDTGSILSDAGPIGGWNLTDAEKVDITAYNEIPNMRMQYIASYPSPYRPVTEASRVSDSLYKPTMVHRKFASGGNMFISTAGLFEDHLFEPSGDMIMRTMNIASFNELNNTWRMMFDAITSSFVAAAELKLRFNTFMLSTVFRPSPEPADDTTGLITATDADRQSLTIYTDWFSSWVIKAGDGILTDAEINEFNFVLQTVGPTGLEPVWQRILDPKTVGQLINQKLQEMDPYNNNSTIQSFAGATRRYMMMVTNPNVEVLDSTNLEDTSLVTAWTKAYSPPFVIPYYKGPYKIRDEMVAGTGVGNGRRIYPPKSFAMQAKATYLNSASLASEVTAKVKLTAEVRRLLQVDDPLATRQVWIPGVSTTNTVMADTVLHWTANGLQTFSNPYQHQYPHAKPNGIDTWADTHYYSYRTNNWPYWGRFGTLSVNGGDRGQDVVGVQKVMNQCVFYGWIAGPYLKEDGFFGSVTGAKVRAFQVWKKAMYIDGIVDAETFSLIGFTLAGLNEIPGWRASVAGTLLDTWAGDAAWFIPLQRMSDDQPISAIARQSWYSNGPSIISQGFHLKFNPTDRFANTDGTFNIYQVNILPWFNNQVLDWMDLTTADSIAGYTFTAGYPGALAGKFANDMQWITVPLAERKAKGVIFRMSSSKAAGFGGTGRVIGIRDVAVYARRQFTTTGSTAGYWVEETYDPGTVRTIEKTDIVEYEATLTFRAGQKITINPMDALGPRLAAIMADEPEGTLSSQTVSSIKWKTDLVTWPNDASLASYFDVTFTEYDTQYLDRNEAHFVFNGYGLTVTPGNYIAGPAIGEGAVSYYTKTENGLVDPYPQKYGWVAKDDGIKLICNANGTPYGFPVSLPSQSATNVHFANYILDADNVDQTTYVGFYDNARKEWVTNAAGEPRITYYDYVRRGPNNMYLAAMTTYELDVTSNLPNSSATIQRPFKWAMPIYGVTTGVNSKIQLLPLNPDLSNTHIWPIPVKTGSFSQSIKIRPKSQGGLTGIMKDYQGAVVNASYGIPESLNGPWSKLYGRPYLDIEDETPLIMDDDAVQVRQYPILTVQEPTATPGLADPWMPVFTVWIRQTLASPWVEVPISDIRDYDLYRGIIYFNTNLPSNDARLVKVSYTSESRVYNLKFDGTNRLNLNPYINSKPEWTNKPLYIYMLPEYVTDANYALIASTVQTRTLRMTTDPALFSPTQAAYEPLAVLLGVVYITTAFKVEDLSILDTRRRGGGATTAYSDEELIHATPESEHYLDVTPLGATTYQKGGFVIIRLPEAVATAFTRQEIINAVERNIAVGVRYKLEKLTGGDLYQGEW